LQLLKCLFDFAARKPEELSITKGEMLTAVKKVSDDWCHGKLSIAFALVSVPNRLITCVGVQARMQLVELAHFLQHMVYLNIFCEFLF
jgi:hypothetical protein